MQTEIKAYKGKEDIFSGSLILEKYRSPLWNSTLKHASLLLKSYHLEDAPGTIG